MALVSQIMLGSLVLPDRAAARPLAALQTAMILCRSEPARTMPSHHRQHHPIHGTACLLDVALELPAVILTPAVIMPPPGLPTGSRMIALPPARAPPAAMVWTLRARGPPNLV
jgi:hypothetical protein